METEQLLASLQLPDSLFSTPTVADSTVGGGVGLVFLFFETAVLFPLPNVTRTDLQIRSSVVGALLGGVTNISNLTDPVIITLPLDIREVSQLTVIRTFSYAQTL